MTFSSWFSCLHVLGTEITDMNYHAWWGGLDKSALHRLMDLKASSPGRDTIWKDEEALLE